MLAQPARTPDESLPIEAIAPEQRDILHRHLPAALISALIHVLLLLALPLFELPQFQHQRATVEVSPDFSFAESSAELTVETPVVLSMTLPDSPLAALAEQFAAKPANLVSAGGATLNEPSDIGDLTTTIGSFTCLVPSQSTAEGQSQFDPAGTRNQLPTRTDLSLQLPDPRILAVPSFSADEMKPEGSPESEVIAAALRWIVSQQHADGSWWRRLYIDDQVLQKHSDCVRMTSLALLPLLAMQQTHQSGKYQEPVSAAVNFLLLPDPDPVDREAEALRTLALCQLFIATRDARVRSAAQSSIKKVIAVNYRPNDAFAYPDYKSTWAWQVFAVRAAEQAGLQDNSNVIPTLRGRAWRAAGASEFAQHIFGWRSRSQELPADPENVFTALAYSSADHRDSVLLAAATQFAARGPALQGERAREADYFTTLLLKKLDHAAASGWNEQLTEHLLDTQVKLGRELGSWEATHKSEETFQATIFGTLILCVPSETLLNH